MKGCVSMKKLTVYLEEETFASLEDYAFAIGITVNEFVPLVVDDFLKLQEDELNEVYLNDEGTKWLFPMDDY